MSGLGLLCYKKNGSALAYKKGGSALIYKGSGPRPITFIANWSPKQFTCNTYGQTHDVGGSVSLSVTSGAATITDSSGGASGDYCRVITVTQAPATIVATLSCSMTCAANEYTDVTFRLMASQRGVTPKQKSATPPGAPSSSTTATININSSGNLTSIT